MIHIINDASDTRLDRYVRRLYPTIPQSVLEKLLRQGDIRVDGKKAKSNSRVTEGQSLTLPEQLEAMLTALQHKKDAESPSGYKKKEQPPYVLTPEDIEMIETNTLWEDDDLFVLNKPHDLAVQGGTGTRRHLDGILVAYGEKKGIRYRLTHRLDRDTSGVIILAKNAQTATHVTNLFRESKVKKIYWAVIVGHIDPSFGTISMPIIKAKEGDREKMVADPHGGRDAKTSYRTIKRLIHRGEPSLTWVELIPETGRTHQLRVHCAYASCPIVGDGKYGGREACIASPKLHLHDRSIQLQDRSGAKLTFVAPLPPHMEETMHRYGIIAEEQ